MTRAKQSDEDGPESVGSGTLSMFPESGSFQSPDRPGSALATTRRLGPVRAAGPAGLHRGWGVAEGTPSTEKGHVGGVKGSAPQWEGRKISNNQSFLRENPLYFPSQLVLSAQPLGESPDLFPQE